jgi:hypothetical protein
MGVYQSNTQFGQDNWFQKNEEQVEEKGPVILVSNGQLKVRVAWLVGVWACGRARARACVCVGVRGVGGATC